jgi:hypothetical protein
VLPSREDPRTVSFWARSTGIGCAGVTELLHWGSAENGLWGF